MRAFLRILLRASLLMAALCVLATGAAAQTPARTPPEPLAIELSAGAMGIEKIPALYWLEEKTGERGAKTRRYVPLDIVREGRGAPARIPLRDKLQLFTGAPDSPDGPKMTPYLDVPARKAGDQLFLLLHLDETGAPKHTFLNDADGSHPAGTVRVVNLTGKRLAFSAGGNKIAVLPGGQQLAKPALREDGRFPFSHFEERPGQPAYESPLKLLRFPRSDFRLLVLFTPMPVQPETDENGKPLGPVTFVPQAMRVYDKQPGAPPPAAPPQVSQTPVIGDAGSTAAPQGSAPPADARECEVGILALGSKWADTELELLIAGLSGSLRAKAAPGTVVPIKIPARGETAVAVRTGGARLGDFVLGSKMTRALLVLAPPAAAGAPAALQLFDASPQSQPQGSLRIFNITPYELAYTTGTQPVYVNPQAAALVQIPPAATPLKLALKVDGAWKLIDQTPRRAPAAATRSGLFVFPSDPPASNNSFEVVEKVL